MGNLLYLVHRLPFPPNKGDKVRSYHLLRHLVAKHRVFLATFVDDPEDEVHVDAIKSICPDLYVARLSPKVARLRSLKGLRTVEALTLHYYRDAGLRRWVEEVTAQHEFDASIVFSSSMAQYAAPPSKVPMLVDFVDVDSAKWSEYAASHRWPLGWLYERESRLLLSYEREVAARAHCSFFVTENEAALFRRLAPECAGSVEVMGNGVDTEYFSSNPARASPFAADRTPLVFTGAMDYWPNIDAVDWFVRQIWPRLQAAWPQLAFHVVGRNPTAAVRALASRGVVVTGTVPDIRPYLQHAAVVVAPLRLARGIQNKILEAMAMGRPVVASSACVAAMGEDAGTDVIGAADADDFVCCIDRLLRSPLEARAAGIAGRRRVLQHCSWDAHLSTVDRHLESSTACEAA